MVYLEIVVAFAIGVILVLLLGWIFSFKTKGLKRILLNTISGAVILVLIVVLKVANISLNPLNALLVGFLGVPGIVVVLLVTLYL